MGSPWTGVITKITHSYCWSSMTNKHLRIGTILLKCLLKNWSKLWMIIRCIVNVQHCIVVFSMVCLCRFRTWWHQSILVENYLGLVEDCYYSLGEHHLKYNEPCTVESIFTHTHTHTHTHAHTHTHTHTNTHTQHNTHTHMCLTGLRNQPQWKQAR